MYRQTKKDEEFEIFFKDFKKKNKGKWESIINGMEITEDLLKSNHDNEKQEEIEMLQEFERRRKFKVAHETNEIIETLDPTSTKDNLSPVKKTQKKSDALTNDFTVETIIKADEEKGEIYDSRYN